MTGNKIITVHSIRRGRRTHQAKRKAPKQSDDYHDGYIKHADRTAKFTRIFQTGRFGCFYFPYIKTRYITILPFYVVTPLSAPKAV